MKIKSFRIRKYRNIQDTGEVTLDDALTCIVGKNQSGKTSLLRGLHKFNPHNNDSYNIDKDWPRKERSQRDKKQTVCEVKFELGESDIQELQKIINHKLNITEVVVAKNYEGNFNIHFPEQPDLLANKMSPHIIDRLLEELPTPSEHVGSEIQKIAKSNKIELKELAQKNSFDELNNIINAHHQTLEASRTEGNPEPHHSAENAYINEYITSTPEKIKKIIGEAKSMINIHQQAYDYLKNHMPTFIYMDDYREFRGTAQLDQVQQRQAGNQLNKEDETFLMILKLANLDLEKLIKQGNDTNSETIRERQNDLEDAATALTDKVSGRWGQNPYEIKLVADGQKFFTEISEKGDGAGMIPLEEQSKGFRWFFSFDLHFMHDSDSTFEGCVLLLDEPGLHLHPGAQDDLLKRLDEYAKKNTLIYTTHLPFLVDLRKPKRIRVITQAGGAKISSNFGDSTPEERLTLQAAFGMKANQSYLVSDKNLIVEGVHDYMIITELSNLLVRSEKKGLNDDIMITVANGASKAVHMSIFMIGQELQVVTLFDSDKEGKNKEEEIRTEWLTQYKNAKSDTLLLGKSCGQDESVEFTIENLFTEDYYFEKLRESHKGKLSDSKHKPKELNPGENNSLHILKKCKNACENLGIEFNKGSVAKAIKQNIVKMKDINELDESTKDMAEKLIKKINACFE